MFENKYYNYPIDKVLEALGCKKGGKDMYTSPFRDEKIASLHIDRAKNLWYDHGAGIGGTNVQLIMMAKHCTQSEAYRFISSLDPNAVAENVETKPYREAAPSLIDIKRIGELKSGYLIRYLESRKIPSALAKLYCCEVITYNAKRDQHFTLVGFENNAGGYALKAPSGIKSSTKAGITTLDMEGKRTVGPSSSSVSVFEGFMDFLSWQVLQNNHTPSNDVVVLNSVNNLSKSVDYLRLHNKIICFLDNDPAGKKTMDSIKSILPGKEIIDMSQLYKNHKDLNELLQNSRGYSPTMKLKF